MKIDFLPTGTRDVRPTRQRTLDIKIFFVMDVTFLLVSAVKPYPVGREAMAIRERACVRMCVWTEWLETVNVLPSFAQDIAVMKRVDLRQSEHAESVYSG